MAADREIIKIDFQAQGVDKIKRDLKSMNVAFAQLGKSQTGIVSGASVEQLQKAGIKVVSKSSAKTPGATSVEKLKRGANSVTQAYNYKVEDVDKTLVALSKDEIRVEKQILKDKKDAERAARETARKERELQREVDRALKAARRARQQGFFSVRARTGRYFSYSSLGKPVPEQTARARWGDESPEYMAEAQRGGEISRMLAKSIKSEAISEVARLRKNKQYVSRSKVQQAYGEDTDELARQLKLTDEHNKSVREATDTQKRVNKIARVREKTERDYTKQKKVELKSIDEAVENYSNVKRNYKLIPGLQQFAPAISGGFAKFKGTRADTSKYQIDQAKVLNKELRDQRGLLTSWLGDLKGVGDIRGFTGTQYKRPTGVSLFADLAMMSPAITGGYTGFKGTRAKYYKSPKKIVSEEEKQRKEETERYKKRKSEEENQIKRMQKTSNWFKNLSTATLMLNMSFLGVYFSFMGLANMLRSGLATIFAPISDIGGTITGSALATAFLGKDIATGVGGKNGLNVGELVTSWKTMQGVQGEVNTLMAKLATSIFTDAGFQSSLFSIIDSLKKFLGDEKLKDAIIGVFNVLSENMGDILNTVVEVVNLTKSLLDFVGKNPLILKAVLYSIIAMPFLSILNLIAGSFSALISLVTGYFAWSKSIQLAQLVAQQTGAATNLMSGPMVLPLSDRAGKAVTSVTNPAAAFLGAITMTDIWNTVSNQISEEIKKDPIMDTLMFQEGISDSVLDLIKRSIDSIAGLVGIDSSWLTDKINLFYDKILGFEKIGAFVPSFGMMSGALNSITNGEGLETTIANALSSVFKQWDTVGGGKQGEQVMQNTFNITIDGRNVKVTTDSDIKTANDVLVRYYNDFAYSQRIMAQHRGY